jgi:hypothetical protein
MATKNLGIIILSVVLAGALGYYVGSRNQNKTPPLGHLSDEKALPVATEASPTAADLENKSQEELTMSLSKIMLPDDEYNKLSDAIYQTALNLLMAQSQAAGLEVSEATQQELKDSINKKYSRQYFADINSNSMKDLSKADLVSILSFYNTEPGQKFLTLSPKIIEGTMASVQNDLSQWLPSTVEAMVNKLKSSKAPVKKSEAPKSKEEALFKDKADQE